MFLASCRLRLALFDDNKCRRPAWARRTLPVPVTLKRLATAFLVFLRATDFGIRGEIVEEDRQDRNALFHPIENIKIGTD